MSLRLCCILVLLAEEFGISHKQNASIFNLTLPSWDPRKVPRIFPQSLWNWLLEQLKGVVLSCRPYSSTTGVVMRGSTASVLPLLSLLSLPSSDLNILQLLSPQNFGSSEVHDLSFRVLLPQKERRASRVWDWSTVSHEWVKGCVCVCVHTCVCTRMLSTIPELCTR